MNRKARNVIRCRIAHKQRAGIRILIARREFDQIVTGSYAAITEIIQPEFSDFFNREVVSHRKGK